MERFFDKATRKLNSEIIVLKLYDLAFSRTKQKQNIKKKVSTSNVARGGGSFNFPYNFFKNRTKS